MWLHVLMLFRCLRVMPDWLTPVVKATVGQLTCSAPSDSSLQTPSSWRTLLFISALFFSATGEHAVMVPSVCIAVRLKHAFPLVLENPPWNPSTRFIPGRRTLRVLAQGQTRARLGTVTSWKPTGACRQDIGPFFHFSFHATWRQTATDRHLQC